MNNGSVTAPTDLRSNARRAAVAVLLQDGLVHADPTRVSAVAGITVEELGAAYPSMGNLFADLVQSAIDGHGTDIPALMIRRRSLTQSITVLNLAVWQIIEDNLDEFQAVMLLNLAESHQPDLISWDGPDHSVHQLLTRTCEQWLTEVATVHDVQWELPVRQLAAQLTGSMYGLLMDYLMNRDGAQVRRILETISFDLGQYGRRRSKNQSR